MLQTELGAALDFEDLGNFFWRGLRAGLNFLHHPLIEALQQKRLAHRHFERLIVDSQVPGPLKLELGLFPQA